MNTETNNRPVRKGVMVIGFTALLVLIAWLSIMIVRNVPGSFASLASLAESVRSFDATQIELASDDEATPNDVRDMLIVTSDINVIETNGNVRLSWTDASTPGSFVFSHECLDGVDITIVEDAGVRDVDCGVNYNLGNVNNVTLNITSETERFVDIPYTIGFLGKNADEPSVTDTAVITVVNDAVPMAFADSSEEIGSNLALVTDEDEETEIVFEEEVMTEEVEEETPGEPAAPASESPATETPAALTPGAPFTQEFTYEIPVSDPNGFIDLSATFVGVGGIKDGAFVSLTPGIETQAVQFEVKNLGTKTSGEWTYEASLPTGQTIESDDQAPLKPNERSVITIGFPAGSAGDFEVIVDTDNDNRSINNRFIY